MRPVLLLYELFHKLPPLLHYGVPPVRLEELVRQARDHANQIKSFKGPLLLIVRAAASFLQLTTTGHRKPNPLSQPPSIADVGNFQTGIP